MKRKISGGKAELRVTVVVADALSARQGHSLYVLKYFEKMTVTMRSVNLQKLFQEFDPKSSAVLRIISNEFDSKPVRKSHPVSRHLKFFKVTRFLYMYRVFINRFHV